MLRLMLDACLRFKLDARFWLSFPLMMTLMTLMICLIPSWNLTFLIQHHQVLSLLPSGNCKALCLMENAFSSNLSNHWSSLYIASSKAIISLWVSSIILNKIIQLTHKNNYIADCIVLSCHVRLFRVHLHSILSWMSRNFLLATGAISEV